MVETVLLKNFKSIEDLTIPLGRVTVLIGENGSGKSNILEAIAFLGAASAEKLDLEFLNNRGIRATEPELMCSAFSEASKQKVIKLEAVGPKAILRFNILAKESKTIGSFPKWIIKIPKLATDEKLSISKLERSDKEAVDVKTEEGKHAFSLKMNLPAEITNDEIERLRKEMEKQLPTLISQVINRVSERHLHLSDFLIYSPEISALRKFSEEGKIQPLGTRGEGLFKMLQFFGASENADRLAELKRSLELTGWFLDFKIPENLAPGEHKVQIVDRFLENEVRLDQRCANEGFLFLMFYFSLFLSPSTPSFFAIDNIDAALNPKLCAELMKRLCALAEKYNKQVILTTHNPSILDGLNLENEKQLLLAVYRDAVGRTKFRRIQAPVVKEGQIPIKLSQAFLRGLLGGLPKNF